MPLLEVQFSRDSDKGGTANFYTVADLIAG